MPGFDWAEIRRLPEVAALTTFAVSDFELEGAPDAQTMFPFADRQVMRTIERPVVLQGRLFSPNRAGEVVVTAQFAANFGEVGHFVTLHLPTPAQSAQGGYDPSYGPPRGPVIRGRTVGVVRSFWFSDGPGIPGGVVALIGDKNYFGRESRQLMPDHRYPSGVRGQRAGSSSKAAQWAGRTALKCRWSIVCAGMRSVFVMS